MSAKDRHSRRVGRLKVLLPLFALVLLSSLFLLSGRVDPDDAVLAAGVDAEALIRDPRMTAPSYAGATSDGTAITLTAQSARPASATRTATADDVTARFDMPDGSSANLLAAGAEIDNSVNELRLTGGVTIQTSSDYTITLSAMTARLDRSGAAGEGPVQGEGPLGTIKSDRFTLGLGAGPAAVGEIKDKIETLGAEDTAFGNKSVTNDNETVANPNLLVFSGNVKLIYLPRGKQP